MLVGQDGNSDDGTGYSASTAKSGPTLYKDVWDILVFAQKWKMEKNLNRLGIGGNDNEVGNSTGEGLGGLVSSFLGLLIMSSLLDKFQNLVGHISIGKWVGFRVDLFGAHLTLICSAYGLLIGGTKGARNVEWTTFLLFVS